MSLVVACERHRQSLIDQCHCCQRSLTWNRPAVDLCACGAKFSESPLIESVDPLMVQFSCWMERKMQPSRDEVANEALRPQDLTALMELIWPLSLDGGLHITYALGTAAGYEVGVGPELGPIPSRSRAHLRKAQEILRRADKLAKNLVKREILSFRVSRPSVVIGLLAEAAAAQASPPDRSLAHSLLLTVMHQRSSKWSSAYPQLSQTSLF
jgi:hypothetical protein